MIKYEISSNTAVITLNRPDKRNALNPELVNELKQTITNSESNDEIKSIIITGEGSAFCAGADLEYLNQIKDFSSLENEKDSKNLAELFEKIYFCSKPTIAAVNGPAIAGGCGLATACDFVFADNEKAKFGYSEVKIGFVPAIVSVLLLKRTSSSKAFQLLLSGDIIDSNAAKEFGIVDFICENSLSEAKNYADRLNSNSQESIKFIKSMKRYFEFSSVDNAIKYLLELNAISRSTDDFKNGLLKFLSK
ncbi:MAG: enoyl-CoA hydratase/isomerase family protein [Ignavibacterium sp.]|nr:enoyl-CoA hydratase/isomerase family protein [Ignavibacterium sp.]MCX7611078.1 enoyl-CoA hydratase/isomerase family protein [Ignavibacterium sp.]MDW8376070.1 enoyl-CoA hydratase/isomerase family protein [Ignavibacteriales bacterium]